jgi:hypothetical protein
MLHGEFLRHIVNSLVVRGVTIDAILRAMEVEVVYLVILRRLLEGDALPLARYLVVTELVKRVETVATEDDFLILTATAIDHESALDIHTTILMEIDDGASINGEGDIRIDYEATMNNERSLALVVDNGILG